MKRVWSLAPWIVAAALGAALAWNVWRPSPGPKVGPVDVPDKIEAQAGIAKRIVATTKADKVYWEWLGRGPNPPQLLETSDPKAIWFIANQDGRYTVRAEIVHDGKIEKDETVVSVGIGPAPPGPGPDPGPLDEFQKALKVAYDSEKDEAAMKDLIDLFEAGAVQVRDAPTKTVYEFYRTFVETGQKLIGSKLPKTRQAAFVLLGQKLPNDTKTELDGPMRTKIAELFSYIAASLGKVVRS